MIKMWLLIIHMVNGTTTHGYFMEKSNCQKVGKSIVKDIKSFKYECRLKRVKLK
jgi:hypothetical protein